MGGKDIAAVVALTFDFRNHVEALVAFVEAVLDVEGDVLSSLDGVRHRPDDGFIGDAFTICLVEFEGRLPRVDETCVCAAVFRLQTLEILFVFVGEPEVADNESTFVLRAFEIGKKTR